MKVLINTLDIGGAERSLETLSKYIDMEVYTLIDSSKMNIKYTPLLNIRRISGPLWYLFLPMIMLKVGKIFKKGDVIVSHLNQSNFVNYMMKRILGTKSVMVTHNLFLNSRIPFERLVMREADMLVFVSKHMEFDGKKYGNKNTTTIYNPIDTEFILSKANEDSKIDDEYLINVGRFVDMKNQDFLIKIYAKIKEKLGLKLVVVGYGQRKIYLRKLAERLGLKVTENPYDKGDVYIISTNNVYPYLKSARAYVHTSVTEGFGISPLEALVFNKPVITSDYKHGSREILDISFDENVEYPKYTDRGVLMPVTRDINSVEGRIWLDIPNIFDKYERVDGLSFIKENFDPKKIAERWKNLMITLEHS